MKHIIGKRIVGLLILSLFMAGISWWGSAGNIVHAEEPKTDTAQLTEQTAEQPTEQPTEQTTERPTEQTAEQPVEQARGEHWKSGMIKINGKDIALPCTLDEFEQTGFKRDTDWVPDGYKINKRSDLISTFIDEKDNKIYVTIFNGSDEVKPIEDCVVGGIELAPDMFDISSASCELPDGITLDSTFTQIKQSYGEPFIGSETAKGNTYYGWTDDTNETSLKERRGLSIYVKDEKIISIQLTYKEAGGAISK